MSTETLQLKPAGRIEYSERAFEQDAHEAMRGDIVRGLIELITNADDAYAKLGVKSGKIRIEVEHRRGADWTVVVRDRAKGMSQTDMRARIVKLAARSSGFELGESVRGNQGRGAKDLTAFGPVLFESIKDDELAVLQLDPTGDYFEPPRGRKATVNKATVSDRKRLGIPRGNGTVVTVTVGSRIVCPQHAKLVERLCRHYQLRDIMADPDREVLLANANTAEQSRVSFRMADGPLVKSASLPIPNYEGVTARLEVRRLPERCDRPATDPYRPGGILIKGRRAVYENTLFGFEGNPHAAYLYGRLVCEHVDQLARDYDDRRERRQQLTKDNPIPIISRAREGLRREHPFYVSLRQAAEQVLEEIVREEEERARREAISMENESTRRSLDRMAREAARFIDEELRNAEVDTLPGTGSGGGGAEPLVIVPSEAVSYLNEMRTLSVIAAREGLADDATVALSTDPEGVVELTDGTQLQLQPHRHRSDLLVAQIHLRPLIADVTLVQAEIEGRLAQSLVEVREERVPTPRPEPPKTLEFERPSYRVGWNRQKVLVLRCPESVCQPGCTVHITSSEMGIVVLNSRVHMEADMGLGWLVGRVKVEGRALGASGTLRAAVGEVTAECRVVVSREGEGPRVTFRLEDKDGGKYRALWEEREDPTTGDRLRVLEIMGRHPALRRYLGEAPKFPGLNGTLAKVLIAEIVADNVCREIARRIDAVRPPEERPDAEGFYAEHYERLHRLLPRLHLMQLPEVPTELGTATPDADATETGGDGSEPDQTGGRRGGRGKKRSAAETSALF